MLIMSARWLGVVPESFSNPAAYSIASMMSELRPPPTPNALRRHNFGLKSDAGYTHGIVAGGGNGAGYMRTVKGTSALHFIAHVLGIIVDRRRHPVRWILS